MAIRSSPKSPGRRVSMIFLVYRIVLSFIMCLCCLPSLRAIFPTTIVRYSLFMLKVQLNIKQTKQTNSVKELVVSHEV